MLKVVGHPNLGNVLNGSQNGSHDTEEVGPEVELVRHGNGENTSQGNDNQAVKNAEATDGNGRLPSGALSTKLLLGDVGLTIAEEDEEEHKAAGIGELAEVIRDRQGTGAVNIHGSEA